ncbi:MAG: hypothetical protein ACKVXR_16970 [Planctomycetota bacterium]
MKRVNRLVLATIFLVAPLARAQQYELHIVPPFSPGGESSASGLNETGQVTGYSSSNELRAYLWSLATGAVDLGEAPTALSNHGDDVNFSGHVAGTSSVAALWTGVDQVQLLPAPTGTYFPFARGINDHELVVGLANVSSNITTGWVWDAQLGTRDLRTLGVTSCTSAIRINNRNQIVGQRLIGNFKAYRFDLGTSALVDLGTLGGPQSQANGINEAGFVCGEARNANYNLRPFLWTPAGGMQDLGALTGTSYDLGRALDLNDQGQVVGTSTVGPGLGSAFLWDSVNGMRDLNALVVNLGTFHLVTATAINQGGWIVGTGRDSAAGSLPRGFVLRPIGSERISLTCSGAAPAATCPCGNSGIPGHGCENSVGSGGASLAASGLASLSSDSLRFTSTGELGSALTIVLQGTSAMAPLNFGDGVRCTGGALKRLYVKNAVNGVVVAPQAGDPSVSARSAALGDSIPQGATRPYQMYYRDGNASFCPAPAGNTFNATSGTLIDWGS